jgi:hypothetical protein
MPVDVLTKRIGSRESFAVEFELRPGQERPLNEWWGSLWLWVNGNCVGDTKETEMVSIGLGSLVNAANRAGSRVSSLLSSLPAKEALDLVMWAVYGDDDPKMNARISSRDSLYQFEILPATDPFFRNWEAILIEEKNTEKFIYRRVGGTVEEVEWAGGTFKATILQAQTDFDRIGRLWNDGSALQC